MTRRALLGGIVLALVLGTPAGGAPSWSPVTQLSSGDRALGPELAVSPAGDAAVVWDQEVGPDCATSPASLQCAHIVELTTRHRGTSSWLTPIELGRPGIGDRPHVAIDDAGDGLVAWVHDIGRDRVLQATFRSRFGRSWPEPNDVSEPSLGVQDFGIALDHDGNAVAAWTERTDAGVAMRVATRNAARGGWGAARTISRPGGNVSGGLSLAVVGATALVLWIEDGVVRETRGDIPADFWFVPTQVSANSGSVAFGIPDVALDPSTGDTVAAWASRTSATCCTLEAATYTSGRGHWEAFVLGSLRSPTDMPRTAIRAHSGAAVWADARGIESATGVDAPQSWSRPTLVSARSSTVAEPDIALDSVGNAVAIWTSGTTGVLQSALRPASGVWQRPVDISTAGASKPSVSSDATLSVWNRSSAPRVAVEASDLTGAGPMLQNLRIPKRGTVRARLIFSVTPAPWSAPLAGVPVWRFGDGRSARGRRVAQRYLRPGSNRVSVTSTDAHGDATTATRSVRVQRR